MLLSGQAWCTQHSRDPPPTSPVINRRISNGAFPNDWWLTRDCRFSFYGQKMCDQTIVYPADFPQSLDEISSLQIEFLIIFFLTSTLSSVFIFLSNWAPNCKGESVWQSCVNRIRQVSVFLIFLLPTWSWEIVLVFFCHRGKRIISLPSVPIITVLARHGTDCVWLSGHGSHTVDRGTSHVCMYEHAINQHYEPDKPVAFLTPCRGSCLA